MPTPRILAFAASLRRDSWNRKLIGVAAQGARQAGAEVTLLDLNEYPLPLYHGDEEATGGVPENARKLYDIFKAHDAFLVSSPEYNGTYPGLLKNMLDWLSRPNGSGDKPFSIFDNKPAAIMGASPGAFGGVRMLPSLRLLLSHFQMLVIPQQHALAKAAEAFDDQGNLRDEKTAATVKGLGERVATLAGKLA